MVTAASEVLHLRRLVGGPPSATSLRCCGIAGIVANFPTWGETSLGALDMSAKVGSGSGSGVERLRLPRRTALPAPASFQLFRRIRSGQAISTFQRTSQFFYVACDLCHAMTFFRVPCRSDPRLR